MDPPPMPYAPPIIPTKNASANIPTVLNENVSPQNSYVTFLREKDNVFTTASGGRPEATLEFWISFNLEPRSLNFSSRAFSFAFLAGVFPVAS
jgi:hypothetical protein